MPRVVPALALASLVTFSLFFIMQGLVAFNDELRLDNSEDFKFVDIIQEIKDPEIKQLEREVQKPPEVEAPPPELPDVNVDVDVDAIDLSIAPITASADIGLTGAGLGDFTDGDYLPLVRVQPQYPRRAAQRGIEGYVIVSLTVNEDGSVPPDSIEIIEEEPSGYFGRAARKAAEKFKYKPKVVNGKGQKVTGVTYKFTFELSN